MAATVKDKKTKLSAKTKGTSKGGTSKSKVTASNKTKNNKVIKSTTVKSKKNQVVSKSKNVVGKDLKKNSAKAKVTKLKTVIKPIVKQISKVAKSKITKPNKAKALIKKTISPIKKVIEKTPKTETIKKVKIDLTTSNVKPLIITDTVSSVIEPYMNEEHRLHFKQILERWRRELMKEVDNTIIEMKEATNMADPNDRATQEETFGLELRTRDRERKLLKKIEEALQQIEDDEYGYCETCGVEIGIERLEARPTATLCIDCKTLAEIREKRA